MKKKISLGIFLILCGFLIFYFSVNSYYVATPTFTVTIPASIPLTYDSTSDSWKASGNVSVIGDITTGDTITVSTPMNLTLADGKGATVVGLVNWGTNGSKTFADTDIKTTSTSSFSVTVSNNSLYAGTWSGNLVFTIAKTTHTHTYTSAVTKAPDYENDGIRTYTCSVCGDSYTEAVAKLPYKTATLNTVYNETLDGIAWILTGLADGTVSIAPANLSALSGNVVIPSKVNGFLVTKVADNAFKGSMMSPCQVTSFVVSEGITSLGAYSFNTAPALTHVDLPTSLISIGDYAFDGSNSILSLIIKTPVTTIGNCAFFSWTSAQTISMVRPNSTGMLLANTWSGSAHVVWGATDCGYNHTFATQTSSRVACGGTLNYTFNSGNGLFTVTCSVCGTGFTGTFGPYMVSGQVSSFLSMMNTNLKGKPHYKNATCNICGSMITMPYPVTPFGTPAQAWTISDYYTVSTGHTHTVCTKCGFVDDNACPGGGTHTWTQTDHKDATCTVAGYTKYTCSKCSRTKTDSISALGHTASATWTNYTSSLHAKICTRCGGAVSTQAHTWTQTAHTDATCTTAGSTSYKCNTCGATKTDTIAALGHTPNGTWINYNDQGHYQYCTRCGTWTAYENHYYWTQDIGCATRYYCPCGTIYYDVYRVIGANSSPNIAGAHAADPAKWEYIENWIYHSSRGWLGPNWQPISFGGVGNYSGKDVYQVYNKESCGLYYTWYAFIPPY